MTEIEAQNLRDKYIDGKIFTRIPGWIVYGRGLGSLKGAELKVLVCICSRMGNKTNIASVTREKINRATGVSLGSISGIIHGFIMQGFIRVEKDGRNNIYYIQFAPPESWPLHRATNAARIKAAPGRREILRQNISSPRIQSTANTPIPNRPPVAPLGDYSDSGLYQDKEEEIDKRWM